MSTSLLAFLQATNTSTASCVASTDGLPLSQLTPVVTNLPDLGRHELAGGRREARWLQSGRGWRFTDIRSGWITGQGILVRSKSRTAPARAAPRALGALCARERHVSNQAHQERECALRDLDASLVVVGCRGGLWWMYWNTIDLRNWASIRKGSHGFPEPLTSLVLLICKRVPGLEITV